MFLQYSKKSLKQISKRLIYTSGRRKWNVKILSIVHQKVIRQLELYKAAKAPDSEELHFTVFQEAVREMGRLLAKLNSTLRAKSTNI